MSAAAAADATQAAAVTAPGCCSPGCWKSFLQIASSNEEMEPGGQEMGLFVRGLLGSEVGKLDHGTKHSPHQ